MTERDKIKAELEDLSPLLAGMKEQEEGFKVPEDYFATLTTEIMAQVETPRKREAESLVHKPSWWEKLGLDVLFSLKPGYTLATLAAIALLLLTVTYWPAPLPENTAATTELSEEEVAAYIVANIDDFSLEMIVQAGDVDLSEELWPVLPEEEAAMDLLIDELLEDMDLEDLEEIL